MTSGVNQYCNPEWYDRAVSSAWQSFILILTNEEIGNE